MNTADTLAALGIIVGIVGIFIGVAYAKASGRFVFRQSGNTVVGSSPDERITVQYDKEDVPRVMRTKITLWNAGVKTLRGSDIVEDYPVVFRLSGREARVLSVDILRASDVANKLHAEKTTNQNEVQIRFDYLEHRQGALIAVIHTSDEWSITASGKIKGSPQGVCELKIYSRLTKSVGGPLLLTLFGYAYVLLPIGIAGIMLANNASRIAVELFIATYVVLAGWAAVAFWRRIHEPRQLSLSSK